MPPQARFEGVVDDEPTTNIMALSERSNPSLRKIPSRFLLVEDPLKAPMNPEEVFLMKRGEQMMKQSRIESYYYSRNKNKKNTNIQPPFVASPPKKKKLFANGFLQRFHKSKLRVLSSIPRKQ